MRGECTDESTFLLFRCSTDIGIQLGVVANAPLLCQSDQMSKLLRNLFRIYPYLGDVCVSGGDFHSDAERMKLNESHGREEAPLEKSAKPAALRCSVWCAPSMGAM